MELRVEFDVCDNQSWTAEDSPFLKKECKLDVMLVQNDEVIKIRSSIFKELDSKLRYMLSADEILREKLELLNIRLENEVIRQIVSAAVNGHGVAVDLEKIEV